jgi:hypothetical protein
MLYLGLVVLSLISCGVGFALEVATGNIGHIKNGREPNAGAAILPTIPLVPVAYVLAAWGLNTLHHNLGYIVVSAYSVLSIAIQTVLYRRAAAALRALQGVK